MHVSLFTLSLLIVFNRVIVASNQSFCNSSLGADDADNSARYLWPPDSVPCFARVSVGPTILAGVPLLLQVAAPMSSSRALLSKHDDFPPYLDVATFSPVSVPQQTIVISQRSTDAGRGQSTKRLCSRNGPLRTILKLLPIRSSALLDGADVDTGSFTGDLAPELLCTSICLAPSYGLAAVVFYQNWDGQAAVFDWV